MIHTGKVLHSDIHPDNRDKVVLDGMSYFYDKKLVYWFGFADDIPEWLKQIK